MDFIRVDLPPQMYDTVVPIASVISNYMVTPIIKGSFSVESIEYLIDTFYSIARSYTKTPPTLLGAVLTKFNHNETRVIKMMKERAERKITEILDELKNSGIVDSNIKYWALSDSIIYYNRILTKLRSTWMYSKESYIVKHLLGKFKGRSNSRERDQLINEIRSLAEEFQRRIKEAGSS